VTPEYEQALRQKARKCPLCLTRMTDEPVRLNSKELDHIVPRNAGGTHTVGNVRIICRSCNVRRPKDGSDYTGPVTLWATA
jgi:5-methylcytosine-specific restriction endonuclease McrA